MKVTYKEFESMTYYDHPNEVDRTYILAEVEE